MKESIQERMHRHGIREADLEEQFVLGSGSGGQKINKTHSNVRLKHLPTGIEVQCQQSRYRETNREIAREMICEALEERDRKECLRHARIRARKRYAKRKPSPAQRARTRRLKQIRSDRKKLRGKVNPKD